MQSLARALALLCMLATLPATLELLLLSVAALIGRWRPPRAPSGPPCGPLVVVVPAHDEESTIRACVEALQGAIAAAGDASLVVVADHCSDATGEIAAGLGARVLVRANSPDRGKGFALRHAWQVLRHERVDALVIVDADTIVEGDFVREVRRHLCGDADAVQVRNLAVNGDASVPTRLVALGLVAMNVVRPLGRERLGFSAGIFGNGFAVRRGALERVAFDGESIVEDLDYHIRLVESGRRARFVASTTVWSEAVTNSRDAERQRARWEGGRLHLARIWIPRLVRGVARGRLRLLEPLLDLLTPPLAYHSALLGLLLVLPWTPGRLWGAFGLAVVGFHAALAVRIGGRLSDLRVLLDVPGYLVWKLALLGRIVENSRDHAVWRRAPRRNDVDSRKDPS